MENNNKETEKKTGTGLTGLANLGNTCFMNTIVQCLMHSTVFNKFLESKKYKKRLNKKVDSLIMLEYDKLREMMCEPVSTTKVLAGTKYSHISLPMPSS